MIKTTIAIKIITFIWEKNLPYKNKIDDFQKRFGIIKWCTVHQGSLGHVAQRKKCVIYFREKIRFTLKLNKM